MLFLMEDVLSTTHKAFLIECLVSPTHKHCGVETHYHLDEANANNKFSEQKSPLEPFPFWGSVVETLTNWHNQSVRTRLYLLLKIIVPLILTASL